VICEILRDDGTMMRMPDLEKFGGANGIPIVTVADTIAWRLRHETFIREVARADLPTDFGAFTVRAFESVLDGRAHLALIMGEISGDEPTLVRVHRANFPGDTFAFTRGHGRAEVEGALDTIARAGRGVFLYLNREETGADLLGSLARVAGDPDGSLQVEKAVNLESRVTFRDFGIGAQILRTIGALKLRILTNSPRRFLGLAGFGMTVVEFVALKV
jgi:3,4-dihydroxy 2-butanone 4-phosphate synthase/GTP cyclohydrolase II